MATLNIRIDDDVKSGAQRVLDEIGLSMSGAISVYLRQITKLRAIPFPLSADSSGLAPTAELAAIIAATEEDIKHDRNLSPSVGKEDLLKYLKGLRK